MKALFIGLFLTVSAIGATAQEPIRVYVTSASAVDDAANGFSTPTDKRVEVRLNKLRNTITGMNKKHPAVALSQTLDGAQAVLEFGGIEERALTEHHYPGQDPVSRALTPNRAATAIGTLVIGDFRKPLTATSKDVFTPEMHALDQLAGEAVRFIEANRAKLSTK
jgi:hypothetical protein